MAMLHMGGMGAEDHVVYPTAVLAPPDTPADKMRQRLTGIALFPGVAALSVYEKLGGKGLGFGGIPIVIGGSAAFWLWLLLRKGKK